MKKAFAVIAAICVFFLGAILFLENKKRNKPVIDYKPAGFWFVNIDGERYVPYGFDLVEVPEEQIAGYAKFDALAKEHGQTSAEELDGKPYAFVDGVLFVYYENWVCLNGDNVYYDAGWRNYKLWKEN